MKKYDDSSENKWTNVDFKKSSYTPFHNDPLCVEVAYKDNEIAVRDSKDPSRAPLIFNKGEWDAFIKGVKGGEFDL